MLILGPVDGASFFRLFAVAGAKKKMRDQVSQWPFQLSLGVLHTADMFTP
jgi:hypothetical protein